MDRTCSCDPMRLCECVTVNAVAILRQICSPSTSCRQRFIVNLSLHEKNLFLRIKRGPPLNARRQYYKLEIHYASSTSVNAYPVP